MLSQINTFLRFWRCKICWQKTLNINKRSTSTVSYPSRINGLKYFSADSNAFMSIFPQIVEDITEDEVFADLKDFTERFKNCINHNVPNGKRIRGLTAVIAYKYLEDPEKLTPENIELAKILGWSIELMQSAILIYDDILDNAFTRRNSPCWFRRPEVGLNAITDGTALNSSVYKILKKYFSTHTYYIQILELFQEIFLKLTLGQSMDLIKYKTDDISMDKFKTIAKYKTGYYTFNFPVVLGMYLSEKYAEQIHNEILPILLDMGEFFQAKNDFDDFFILSSGKIVNATNDIEESKCTWLAAVALEKSTPEQKQLMAKHYGKSEKESTEIIKKLYNELDLLSEFHDYKKRHLHCVCKRIDCLKEPYRNLLRVLVEKLYSSNLIFNM